MQTNRRGFLGLVLAAAASPAIVRAESLMKLAVPPRLVLWGDGVHDDTEALQAFLDGRPVQNRSSAFLERDQRGKALVMGGLFVLSAPLVLRSSSHVSLMNNSFRFLGDRPFALPFRNTSQ